MVKELARWGGVGRALLDSEKMEGSLRVLFLRTWGRGWR